MRCDAIIICAGTRVHEGQEWVNGQPCGRDAVAQHDGHGVCWVHLQAVSGPRVEMGMPVEFAKAEAACST